MKRAWILLVVALLWAGQALTQSVSSTRLTDTIDKGVGNVDLMKDVTAVQLEILRSANGGRLVFGVDINEAANGTEKATSQGVTVADAWLEVGFADGTTRVYGHAGGFWTETQALVAANGSTARAEHYTLLGESGSNRITASNAVQGIFDSTLKIAVPDRLDAAVSAVLKVRLLDTNVKLGDPEAFYDYTAGFEDLAILVPADAAYLDTVLPQESTFRSDAPAMELSPQGEQTQAPSSPSLSWIQYPGADSYYMAAYEDMAPDRGDYDFNDLVVAYRYQLGVNADGLVERIDGIAYLVARGSVYRHDWILDLPLVLSAAGNATCATATGSGQALLPCSVAVAGGRLRWTAFRDTVAAFPAPGAAADVPVNTPAGNGFTRGPKATFSVTFAAPVAVGAIGAGSPWLDVRSTAKSVALADRDLQGYPFAMLMPSAWRVPVERKDMGLAYPQLAAFVASAGNQSTDWYRDPVASLVQPWTAANWAW